MTKKENFIKVISYIFEEDTLHLDELYTEKEWTDAAEFFKELKENKIAKSSDVMTENGKKILSWMQENIDKTSNIFTSKEIAEALFTSGRSVAGSMRKLVADGYVEKAGGYDCNKTPVTYSLTEAGKSYQFEN